MKIEKEKEGSVGKLIVQMMKHIIKLNLDDIYSMWEIEKRIIEYPEVRLPENNDDADLFGGKIIMMNHLVWV